MDVKMSLKNVVKTDHGTYVSFCPPVRAGKDSKKITDAIIIGYPNDIESGDLHLEVNDENGDAFEPAPLIILWPDIDSQVYVDFYTKHIYGEL